MTQRLRVELLSAEAFAPFGDIIHADYAKTTYAINAGTALRFHDLATVDVAGNDGRALISIFRAQAQSFPISISMLERHPLGSQAFVPLSASPYLIVVSLSPQDTPRAFLAARGEGVNYHRGTWHHPLLALQQTSDFLVVDRGGAGANCDEELLPACWAIESADG